MTVLFCDLVGFTAASEAADPEDVRARIRPYHARLREEIERYGGTVEKFIGDAVMAVFGAPVAHEDDAERAVRAGLRILEAIEELNGQTGARLCRCASASTPARRSSPRRPARAGRGDRHRRHGQHRRAAPGGGARRRRSSSARRRTGDRSSHRVRELEPVEVKGKAEPVAVWRGRCRRARAFGVDVDQRPRRRSSAASTSRAPASHVRARARESVRRSWSRSSASPVSARAGSSPSSSHRSTRTAGADPLAPGPVPAVRRGHHVLGARRDRQGACRVSSSPTPPRRPEASSRRPSPARGGRGRAHWLSGTCRRSSGWRHEPSAADGASRSPPGGASSRRSPRAAARARVRGPALGGRRAPRLRRPPGRLGRAVSRSSSSHGAAGAVRAAAGLGRRQARTRHDLALSALARRDRAARSRRCSSGRCFAAETQPSARARRRQPALRRGVRAHARRATATSASCPETVQG